MIETMTTVVPISGSSMTSVAHRVATGTSGTRRGRQLLSACLRRADNNPAPHKASASLITSLGWMTTGPNPIQRVEPFTDRPKPGTSNSTRSAVVTTSSGSPTTRRNRRGNLLTSNMSGTPRPTHRACLKKK